MEGVRGSGEFGARPENSMVARFMLHAPAGREPGDEESRRGASPADASISTAGGGQLDSLGSKGWCVCEGGRGCAVPL